MEGKKLGFSTRQIHGGKKIESAYGAHKTPVFRTSTFDLPSAKVGAERFAGKDKGYKYTRLGNPIFDLLTSRIADLENAYPGFTFGSGMGAIHSVVFGLINQKDHLVTSDTLYGCTDSLFRNHVKRFGIEADFVDTRNIKNIKNAIKSNTKLIFIETPTNPTLGITDIKETAELAKESGLITIVDNTFATPYLQRPVELGADVVLHSLTKDIGGHSDFVGGVSVYSKEFSEDEEYMSRLKRASDDFGATFNPEDAFLALRGLETLSIRMNKKCENSQAIAEFLEGYKKIERVYFPGLRSFPQYELAKKQMSGPGGVIWFIMKGGYEAGEKLMNSVKLCSLAVSLGSTATLIQHPASMTHRIVPKEEREKVGIVDGGVRLAVGLEDKEDIIADLEEALEKA
jgi:methionine-gamma-lyase